MIMRVYYTTAQKVWMPSNGFDWSAGDIFLIFVRRDVVIAKLVVATLASAEPQTLVKVTTEGFISCSSVSPETTFIAEGHV